MFILITYLEGSYMLEKGLSLKKILKVGLLPSNDMKCVFTIPHLSPAGTQQGFTSLPIYHTGMPRFEMV